MAKKQSAGLIPYRIRNGALEVFLVHPGGPFWAKKDEGAWSMAKGEYQEGEDPLEVARREFEEETGFRAFGPFLELGSLRQPGGKLAHAWAVEGDDDPDRIVSNTFEIEWPPRSGVRQTFPEVDRAGWFVLAEAFTKILRGQAGFLRRLEERLRGPLDPARP